MERRSATIALILYAAAALPAPAAAQDVHSQLQRLAQAGVARTAA